jgi:hypothetical protein
MGRAGSRGQAEAFGEETTTTCWKAGRTGLLFFPPPTLYFHLRPPKWPVWSIHWPTDEPAHTTSSNKSACVSSRTGARRRVAIAVPLIHSTR